MGGDLTETVTQSREVGDASGDDGRPCPCLIVVLDCERLTIPALRVSLVDLDELTLGRDERRSVRRHGKAATLLVPDHEVSRTHLALRRHASCWEVADLDSRNGMLVNGESTRLTTLGDGDVIEAGGTFLVFRDQPGLPGDPGDRDLAAEPDAPIVFRTVSTELQHRLDQLTRVAPASVPILIRGETGTGKELVARAIHDCSGRGGPFVPVNCGALPRSLVESELFGHRCGAFSGAYEDRAGLVGRAHGGTLFLDEIAELPEESQVALLRVLQDGELRPVGASELARVDIRLVVATHQDLAARIASGRFRQDLYARIARFDLVLPPLRDRREDLGTLIAAILPRIAPCPERVTLHRAAARALLRHAWPLNVRELEQALRAAVALADTGEIRVAHLSEAIRTRMAAGSVRLRSDERMLYERLSVLLREHDGNVSAVARAMGKAPIQVRRWCHRLHIELSRFRTPGAS